MVAVIKTGHSIHRIFNYNENKVKEGLAECIGAGNYPIDAGKMALHTKLNRLLKQMELNENVKRNSVHISLNFDVSESHLSKEKLLTIADSYLDKIGFGKQPYLIYQHHDAGHPHLHLVTTNIEADGKRIDLHHLGIRKSEPARKAIEKEFGLASAEAQRKKEQYGLKPVSVSRAIYGQSQTKMAIQNILEVVLNQYKYTSLMELNAVLKQYNVIADRGSEHSRVYQHKGLLYHILDTNGHPIGVPIKASLFYNKPTLKYLEEKFKENEAGRILYKARIKNAIDMALKAKMLMLQDLIKALSKQGIATVVRQNDTGLIYGITYVDHQTKCVFNGSDLGKGYSAKGIQERCCGKGISQENTTTYPVQNPTYLQPQNISTEAEANVQYKEQMNHISSLGKGNALDTLMQPVQSYGYLPYPLKKRKKKKQKHL